MHKKRITHNPNKFWKMIKQIFPTKTKESPVRSFVINGNYTTDKKTISSGFCSFFSNVAGTLKTKCFSLKNFVWSPPFSTSVKTNLKFKLKPVTVSEVFVQLKKLKRKKAAGPDNLPRHYNRKALGTRYKLLNHNRNRPSWL